MFADREAHTGPEAKRGGDGPANDAVSAHDSRRYIAQSPCHVCFPDLLVSLEPKTRFSPIVSACPQKGMGINDAVAGVLGR